ncbi:MAG: hypothetical protein KDD44_09800, partial [Bdellovibrionales bacterium]|nr:hypothetical protein [Bdellovibrionales bacterium]
MQQSIQDQIGSENHCHGCGPANSQGLQLKSFLVTPTEARAVWRPKPQHCAGSERVVNGGILASLIDCHCVNLAMAAAYGEANRSIGSEPKLWCVTA